MEDRINSALGITDILIDAINKKYDSIRDLNSLKVNSSEENFEEINPVIDSIIEDENNHIGKLQQLVDLLSGGTDEIEEGRAETIEIIDTGSSVVESITTMKKKLVLSENFDNVIDDVQAVADPVFVGANEEHDENKKKFEDAVEENKKEAEETIPKEGETGEKIKSKALKQMHLSEKLFESSDSSLRDEVEFKIRDILTDKVEDNLAMTIASLLDDYDPSWAKVDWNDDNILEKNLFVAKSRYIKALSDMLLADKDSLNEELSFEDYSRFNSAIYNAISDVMFDFKDEDVTKSDLDKALEWFDSRFWEFDGDEFETEKMNHMTGIRESLEDEVDEVIAVLDEVKKTGKQNDSWIDLLYNLFDKYGKDKVKAVFYDRRNDAVNESLQVGIAKEQIKRFTEGKMPKNWNVDTYLEKLTEKKHISSDEAKSLKEWYSNIK